jgi:hypothetical protein
MTKVAKEAIKPGVYLKALPHLGYTEVLGINFKKQMFKIRHEVKRNSYGLPVLKTRYVHASELANGRIFNSPKLYKHTKNGKEIVSEFPYLNGEKQGQDINAVAMAKVRANVKHKRGPVRRKRGKH